MKTIKYLITGFFFIIFTMIINLQSAEKILHYACTRNTYDHPWWNPLTWFNDYYYYTHTHREAQLDENTWVIHDIYDCYGNGQTACPSCSSIIIADPYDEILDNEFLDNSADLMENYIIDQLDEGNYTGYQSFNTYYNGYTIYRNVTWNGDTTTTNITVDNNILPLITP